MQNSSSITSFTVAAQRQIFTGLSPGQMFLTVSGLIPQTISRVDSVSYNRCRVLGVGW